MCSEKEIFDDLSKLCISEGFIHIVAYFCFRDNMIFQKTESLTPHDIEGHLLKQPLIRTEISTLLGLMVKGKIELKLPSPDNMSNMITSSEKFLEKIHKSMLKDCNLEHLIRKTPEKNSSNPFADAKILRETIFYARDSAYLFQYYDFAVERYSRNDTWLLANKGYLIHDVRNVISCIEEIQKNKMHLALQDLKNIPREQWTVLPGFEFKIIEIEQIANINANTIRKILDAFTIPKESNNQTFLSVSDYNISNSHPLIKVTEDRYILFQIYSLAEAFYESPIFWFREDNSYKDEANKNNGIFTEEFTRKRLKLVFGCQNVFSNITIYKGSKSVGEIDVLVVFADRVVIVQAKSKRLTIGARKGNDNCIQGDFQKAIQDAYDQGVLCAKLLEDDNYDLYDSSLQKLEINRSFKEVYIVCIVSDHYPALNFQSRQFLKYTQTDKIFAPFVM